MTDTPLNFGDFSIIVGGTGVAFSLEDLEDLKAPDLIATWGHVLAEAEAEQLRVDTEYRAWRAMNTTHILKKDSKLAEWKIRARIEDDPTFKQYKEGAAVALRNVVLARGVYEACKARALTSPSDQ